jgi:hypothetical protein
MLSIWSGATAPAAWPGGPPMMVAPRDTGAASPRRAATGDPAGRADISHRPDIFVAEISKGQICSIGARPPRNKKRQRISSTMLMKYAGAEREGSREKGKLQAIADSPDSPIR